MSRAEKGRILSRLVIEIDDHFILHVAATDRYGMQQWSHGAKAWKLVYRLFGPGELKGTLKEVRHEYIRQCLERGMTKKCDVRPAGYCPEYPQRIYQTALLEAGRAHRPRGDGCSNASQRARTSPTRNRRTVPATRISTS